MANNAEQERLRLEIAAVLDAIASHEGWSDELWSKFNALLERANVDGILAHADEELIHYSGEFNSKNLLMLPAEPDKIQVSGYKSEFRQLADAIRSGMSWDEYKRANRIFETGDLGAALKRAAQRLLKRLKPES